MRLPKAGALLGTHDVVGCVSSGRVFQRSHRNPFWTFLYYDNRPIMAFKLELLLLRDRSSHGNIRNTLFKHLDDATTLYRLRAASKLLRDFVDLDPKRLWGTLHVHAPLRMPDKPFTLDRISPSCHRLIIKVRIPDRTSQNKPKRASFFRRSLSRKKVKAMPSDVPVGEIVWPQDLMAYEVDRQLWTYIFKKFKNLETLAFRVEGDPCWPGRGEVEHALTSLRCALERAELTKLRSFYLSPIHICGILHLRWHGFGALYEVASPEICANLWQSITLLDIRLSSPMYTNLLTEAQTKMSIKILQSYLRGFAPTLRFLCFVWLDGNGPSPLLLDEEPGMETIQRLRWPRLEELYFGMVTATDKTIQAIPERAPKVRLVKVLRSTHRFSRMEAGDSEAWIERDWRLG